MGPPGIPFGQGKLAGGEGLCEVVIQLAAPA